MSRNRFENLEPERQERLFESATEEFADHGYDAASLNRILEKAGMSKSSLYYYFDDKADLFTTMFERAVLQVLRQVGGFDLDQLTAETYWDEIDAFYRRSTSVISRNDWYLRLARTLFRLHDSNRKLPGIDRLFEMSEDLIDKVLRRGQELGAVRTDLPHSLLVDAAMGLGVALDRWSVENWGVLGEAERLAVVTVQMNMLRRLFGKDAEENLPLT